MTFLGHGRRDQQLRQGASAGVNFYKVKRLKFELMEIWEKAFNGGD